MAAQEGQGPEPRASLEHTELRHAPPSASAAVEAALGVLHHVQGTHTDLGVARCDPGRRTPQAQGELNSGHRGLGCAMRAARWLGLRPRENWCLEPWTSTALVPPSKPGPLWASQLSEVERAQ